MASPYIIGLRYESAGWRKWDDPRITLTPSDPFIDDLSLQTAERLIENNWAVRHVLQREVDAFENGNIPPFDPTGLDYDQVRSNVGAIAGISKRELKALAELEKNGPARADVLELLNTSRGHPEDYSSIDLQP